MAEATTKQIKNVFLSLSEEEAEVLKEIANWGGIVATTVGKHSPRVTEKQADVLLHSIWEALEGLRD